MLPRRLDALPALLSLFAILGVGCDVGSSSASTLAQAGSGGGVSVANAATGVGGAGSPVSSSNGALASSGSTLAGTGGAATAVGPASVTSTSTGTSVVSSSAQAGAGGATTGPGGGGGGPSSGPFTLAWQDDFNTLDASAWQLQTFTFGGNLAQFSTQNASVADGILTIHLTPNPASTTEPYFGVEMRSTKTLTYGKVSARMRFASGSGVVSGLVLFYTPYPNCNWNEIDIEHLGDSSNTSQLNAQVFLGTPVANCATSVSATQDPLITDLGLNAEADFHQYDIEWTTAGINYLVDGTLLRTWTKDIALMNLPQTILLTIWASNAASWAGAITPTSAPTSADVDWIKVYNWVPN